MDAPSFHMTDPGRDEAPIDQLGRGLGWFGVGVGLAELALPGLLARVIGAEPGTRTSLALRAAGVREVVSGLAVLLRPRRTLPLWARVAGDVMDLGLLALASSSKGSSNARLATTAAAVAGVAALEIYTSRTLAAAQPAEAPLIFTVTINKPPPEVYAFYRKLSNLPLFMDYLESVEERSLTRSHWVAKLPIAGTTTWDAEITEDRSGEVLAWRTVAGSVIAHRGKVTFAKTPGRNGTEVRVEWEIGLGGVGASPALARLLTRSQVKGDLRRLKQVMETGEVLFSDASSHRGKHPAQPSPDGAEHAAARAAESGEANHAGVLS